ncbi:TonB-dependent receptor [Flavobacterium amnicola]|uniref:TonB-dependent receptor n=1 Tax=Flavobacterium amnicola TaxID=2506422 RepID=A0A4V1N255_9FLAO|nr:TonB-dependent receptor [Flavobacterium amnicola]RXR20541.1 TonB-dependent receptor [Flavobacterium amnicola]
MKNILLFFVVFLAFKGYSQDTLQTVKVEAKRGKIQKSLIKATNTTVLSSKELLKAACCNLAESFETNPTIDVNFSDALTGTKQIKMLGLTSPYLLIAEENIPSVRGASQAYGLSFTPGTWVESIQITKGAGSVVNGYESISGQINTELLKPVKEIPFFLNVYGSTDSRFEVNTHLTQKVDSLWSTSLLVHGNMRVAKNDMNNDGFLDNPLGNQINVMNRWQYSNPNTGWVSFLNARFMNDEKQTGQIDFDPKKDKLTTNYWGSEINTQRFDFSSKLGYVWKDMPYQSIGFQNAYTIHNQNSYFGLRTYDIKQKSFYSNLIFNSIIDNTLNKFATGLNFTSDEYQEFVFGNDLSRKDNSVGAFLEYTYDNTDNFSVILGGRADYHNRLGFFVTPRLHARYNPWKDAVLRFSAGRGKRSANIFAENQHLFGSSRTFNILDNSGKIYGLNPEIAWNYGFGFLQKFEWLGMKSDASLDFYRTDFQNQAVVDLFQTNQVNFYNLKGKSYANSLQVEFNTEIIKHLNFRSAYKFYDIKTDYNSGSFQRPLQAKHRFFTNLEFETHIKDKGQQWKFDYTLNWFGQQQLPNTNNQLPDFSPTFIVMNSQVTRTFSSVFEMYLGVENLGNYKQNRAIVGYENPFGTNFDTSAIYAPVFGQMFYAGLRFKVK